MTPSKQIASLAQVDIISELQTGEMPAVLRDLIGLPSRILARTESLVLLPTVSPVAAGHVLVFSLGDFASFHDAAAANPAIVDQLTSLLVQYEARFGPAICFEHGSSGLGIAACGVSRAHVHFVPARAVDVKGLLTSISADLQSLPTKHKNWMSVPELRGKEYLMISFSDTNYVWSSSTIASQLVRRLIVTQLGGIRWDWKELFGCDCIRDTIETWGDGCVISHGIEPNRTLLQA
jgi:diadenosine tetraphosphate (Ap4A) HIT family hydrolase